MTDSSKIPNIHGPKSGQESSNEKHIDPEKFKRINQVDESDEANKRHNRNLKKEEEEEEDEKISGDTPEGSAFGELMEGKQKLQSIYDIDTSKNPPIKKKSSLGSSHPAPPSQTPHLGNTPHPSLQHEQDDRFYISTGSPTTQSSEREKPRARASENPINYETNQPHSQQNTSHDTPASKEKSNPLEDSDEDENPHQIKPLKKKPLIKPEETEGLRAPSSLGPLPKKGAFIDPLLHAEEEHSLPLENPINKQELIPEEKLPIKSPHSINKKPVDQLPFDEKKQRIEPFEIPPETPLPHHDLPVILPPSEELLEPSEEQIATPPLPQKGPTHELKSSKEIVPTVSKKQVLQEPLLPDEKETRTPTRAIEKKLSALDEPEEEVPISVTPVNPFLIQPTGDMGVFTPDDKEDNQAEKITSIESNLIQPFMTLMPTSVPVEMPVYTRLSKEVFEIFEKMVGLMTIEKGNGISTTTVTINLPHSPFNKSVLILEHYDTAPNAFNVELQGSAHAVNLFNENLSDLISAFQYSKLTYEVNVRRAVLLPEERGVNKRKEDITKDLK